VSNQFLDFWRKYIEELKGQKIIELFPEPFDRNFPFKGRFSFRVDLLNNRVYDVMGLKDTLGYAEHEKTIDELLFSDFIHPDHRVHFMGIVRSILEFEYHLSERNKISVYFKLLIKHKNEEYKKFFVSSGTTLATPDGRFAGGYFESTEVDGMADSSNFGWDIVGDEKLVKSFKTLVKKRMSSFLTKRELQVLECLKEGLSSKMIAVKLGIAKNTVDNFRSNLLKKSSAGNTAQLIAVAQKNGWI